MAQAYLFAALSLIVVVAGAMIRMRLRAKIDGDRPSLDDEAIRRIEATGALPIPEEDDPLEPEEIERAEEEFWDEYWDEPEPY